MDTDSADLVLSRFPSAVLSHHSAARVLGLALLEDPGDSWITVPRAHSHVEISGWSVRRADLPAGDILALADGTRVTTSLRTTFDLARVLPVDEAVVVADSAIYRGRAHQADLVGLLAGASGRGAARPRAVAPLVDGRAESVIESLLRLIIGRSDLPQPLVQHRIPGVRGKAIRADFCWPAQRLVVEADGFAFHSDRAAYRRDRERMNELERLGWRVLRFTYEDVRGDEAAVVSLIRECLTVSAAA